MILFRNPKKQFFKKKQKIQRIGMLTKHILKILNSLNNQITKIDINFLSRIHIQNIRQCMNTNITIIQKIPNTRLNTFNLIYTIIKFHINFNNIKW